jgi:hypothetical protein
MKFGWILGVIFSCVAGSSLAEQGCPSGQIPAQANGNIASCGPIPDGYYQQQGPVAPRPSGEWIKTWGAISMGSIDDTTSFGVTTGKLSKLDAEEDSLRRCASHGEDNCKVLISYHNQCVAISEPQIDGLPFSTGVVNATRAGTTFEASKLSAADCAEKNKKTPHAQCKVTYTACTEQIFHKY